MSPVRIGKIVIAIYDIGLHLRWDWLSVAAKKGRKPRKPEVYNDNKLSVSSNLQYVGDYSKGPEITGFIVPFSVENFWSYSTINAILLADILPT